MQQKLLSIAGGELYGTIALFLLLAFITAMEVYIEQSVFEGFLDYTVSGSPYDCGNTFHHKYMK